MGVLYRFSLDVGKMGSQASIRAKQGDAASRAVRVLLLHDGVPYAPEAGTIPVLRGIKPDETVIFSDCEVDGHTVLCALPLQAMAVAGVVRFEIELYGPGAAVLYSPKFDLFVEETLYPDSAVESSGEFSALTSVMTGLLAYNEQLEANEAGRQETMGAFVEMEGQHAENESERQQMEQ